MCESVAYLPEFSSAGVVIVVGAATNKPVASLSVCWVVRGCVVDNNPRCNGHVDRWVVQAIICNVLRALQIIVLRAPGDNEFAYCQASTLGVTSESVTGVALRHLCTAGRAAQAWRCTQAQLPEAMKKDVDREWRASGRCLRYIHRYPISV